MSKFAKGLLKTQIYWEQAGTVGKRTQMDKLAMYMRFSKQPGLVIMSKTIKAC